MRTETSRGSAVSRETSQSSCSLILWSTPSADLVPAVGKCKRGGSALVEPWQEGGKPWRGENPREESAPVGGLNGPRQDERTPDEPKPLKAERANDREETTCAGRHPRVHDRESQEGQGRREALPASPEGKPLKGEPQERYRRERKPERFREEQSVKRLRKPEGAA
jgi:hypothetical protein